MGSTAATERAAGQVAWQSYTQDGSSNGVFAQRFILEGACCTGRGPGTPVECLVTTALRCQELDGLYRGDGTGCGPGGGEGCFALEVTMESMSAVETPQGVVIRWATAAEIDTVSFRVLREILADGEGVEKSLDVVAPMIPAAGHGLVGASYEFLDNSKQAAFAVHYYLEDIDLWGKVTRHGPIVVDRGQPTETRTKVDRKVVPRR